MENRTRIQGKGLGGAEDNSIKGVDSEPDLELGGSLEGEEGHGKAGLGVEVPEAEKSDFEASGGDIEEEPGELLEELPEILEGTGEIEESEEIGIEENEENDSKDDAGEAGFAARLEGKVGGKDEEKDIEEAEGVEDPFVLGGVEDLDLEGDAVRQIEGDGVLDPGRTILDGGGIRIGDTDMGTGDDIQYMDSGEIADLDDVLPAGLRGERDLSLVGSIWEVSNMEEGDWQALAVERKDLDELVAGLKSWDGTQEGAVDLRNIAKGVMGGQQGKEVWQGVMETLERHGEAPIGAVFWACLTGFGVGEDVVALEALAQGRGGAARRQEVSDRFRKETRVRVALEQMPGWSAARIGNLYSGLGLTWQSVVDGLRQKVEDPGSDLSEDLGQEAFLVCIQLGLSEELSRVSEYSSVVDSAMSRGVLEKESFWENAIAVLLRREAGGVVRR